MDDLSVRAAATLLFISPANLANDNATAFVRKQSLPLRQVSLSSASDMQDEEERVYRVFVAPGPSYVAAVNASVEFPFVGLAFSYIVPGGGAPFPFIAAHDVGSADGAEGEGCRSGGAERTYVIVLNAVDTIRVLEVCVCFCAFVVSVGNQS